VRASADGEVVILHDETVDRTTDGRGPARELSLKELKRLDAGYRFTNDGGRSYPYRGKKIEIPTLAELFSLLPDVRAIVEIKQADPPIVEKVIELARAAGKEGDVLLATEEDGIMRASAPGSARESRSPRVSTTAKWRRSWSGWPEDRREVMRQGRGRAGCRRNTGVTLGRPGDARAAHALGLEIFVWTVNEPAEMARLLDLGVDGIITDYPERLRTLLAGR
jgi:glycerophosphoryl diester phosphodiesterase